MESPFESLELTPDELRALGAAVVELMVEALEDERRDPVLPSCSGGEVRALFDEPPPRRGVPAAELLELVRARFLPTRRKNGHPRFFGYVCASADPVGALFDGLASLLNQNVTAWRSAPGATEMERTVVGWLGELVGFEAPGTRAEGLLVSGGSAANALAVAAALRAAARGAELARALPRLVVYRSAEGHVSLDKAFRVFGVPAANVRALPVDERRRIVPAELARALARDREAGRTPACVCASAGTVNTGAIDPLEELAEVCARHGVWLHVDGAYGAPAAMTDDYAWLRRGFARVDSLSLDPHKWLFAPLDVGCVLLRDARAARAAFHLEGAYLSVTQEDPLESFAFFEHGPELSRRVRAFKVWAILKTRGADRLARVIAANVALRRRLDARVAAEPRLELLGSGLGISCFRWRGAGEHDGRRLDAVNRAILERLVREGRFFLSPTTLEGRFTLRTCIVSFRTQPRDVDLLVEEVLRLGEELDGGA